MTTERAIRPYPNHKLSDVLIVPQKIRDEKAGNPMNRLLLAHALGIKPASSNFRLLLSSSHKYGLTDGTEKAAEIKLTELGRDITGPDPAKQRSALRKAALAPTIFGDFYQAHNQARVPTIMERLLVEDYSVPEPLASECAEMIIENGRLAGLVHDISGTPHVMLDVDASGQEEDEVPPDDAEPATTLDLTDTSGWETVTNGVSGNGSSGNGTTGNVAEQGPVHTPDPPSAMFVGHGKNRKPLQALEKILTGFQIPFKVVVDEPNLGRPIPAKVKQVMQQCGSAVLIFTKDELLYDADQQEVWRPSENVVHELGAASYAYEDRVVILKEKGLNLPTNFSSLGYIEFEPDALEAKTMDLLKELIGFGLVRLVTT